MMLLLLLLPQEPKPRFQHRQVVASSSLECRECRDGKLGVGYDFGNSWFTTVPHEFKAYDEEAREDRGKGRASSVAVQTEKGGKIVTR